MNSDQLDKVRSGRGFFAALDQSGGSTPHALESYGIPESSYSDDRQMFDLMHEMRARIMQSPGFDSRILGAILFADTIDRQVDGKETAEYLWGSKGVVPFLKVDLGLAPEDHGVQLMKPLTTLDSLLEHGSALGLFGTKMRSFIKSPDETGIRAVVGQQFETARRILAGGLVPILEPEVDIHAPAKADAEQLLKTAISERLEDLAGDEHVMLKLSLPDQDNFYADFVSHPKVLRVLALSGGYQRDEAVRLLSRNNGVIASFSPALTEGLSVDQNDQEFDATLDQAIESIYEASLT